MYLGPDNIEEAEGKTPDADGEGLERLSWEQRQTLSPQNKDLQSSIWDNRETAQKRKLNKSKRRGGSAHKGMNLTIKQPLVKLEFGRRFFVFKHPSS